MTAVLRRLRRAWLALLDLVLPTPCGGCGAAVAPGGGLCDPCRGTLARPVPVPEIAGLPPAMALAPYAGAPRTAVIAYKERGRRDLAEPLAGMLDRALTGLGVVGPCLLVPAPSTPGAARARGGDHMVRLARRVARRRGGRVGAVLGLRRGARDSVGLDAAARAGNLAAHLRARPEAVAAARDAVAREVGRGGVRPAVVLLDDVLTTGATALACARVLAAAGLPVDLVLVVTAVGARRPTVPGGRPRRSPPEPTHTDEPRGRPRSAVVRPGPSSDPAAPRPTPSRHPPDSLAWPTSPVVRPRGGAKADPRRPGSWEARPAPPRTSPHRTRPRTGRAATHPLPFGS